MISVLMCTYNRGNCIRRAIDSVLNQIYQDYEFIIVDDGSTDDTEEIVKAYADKRIRYLALETNSYYCYAANYGIQFCQGDYIAFINSDDEWEPDKLEKQVEFLENHAEYGACFSAVSLIDSEGNDITDKSPFMRDLFATQYKTQKECIQRLIKQGNTLCHPSAIVRKTVLEKVGNYNLMFCQLADYDLWIRIVSEFPVYVFEERLTRFRWDEGKTDQISSGTAKKRIRTVNEQVLVIREAIERLPDEKFLEFFREDLKNPFSDSHIEVEFEKAFFMAECLNHLLDTRVLGIDKLEKVLRQKGAVDVLKTHFRMKIFDIYEWNTAHSYMDRWVKSEVGNLQQKAEQLQQHVAQLQQQIECQNQHIENQKKQIEQQRLQLNHQNQLLEQKNHQINEQEQLIATYANSTSWKVTEPLRRFTRMFKK